MVSSEKMRVRAQLRAVRDHIDDTRHKFGIVGRLDLEDEVTAVQMEVLTEEVGKLARAGQKARLAKDPRVRQLWEGERAYRCVTVAAVATRIGISIESPPKRYDGR